MSAVHKIWTPFPHTQSPNCSSAPCHGSNGATPLIDLSEVMLGQAFSFLYMSPDSNKMHQPSLMLSDRLAVRLYTQVSPETNVKSTDLGQGESGPDLDFWGSRYGWFPKFIEDLFVQWDIYDNSFMNMWSVFERYEPKCRISQCSVEEPLEIRRSGSKCGWLPKFNQFFFAHRYISGKIFVKMKSVAYFLHELASRQTERQIDKRRVHRTM